MKKITLLAFLLTAFSFLVHAQDEGAIVKKERIDRSQGFFFGLGPSFTFGDNIGDYSTGFNIEAGYQKRLNRVFSIGPSISYISFKYDPETTTDIGGSAYVGTGDPLAWGTKYNLPGLDYTYGYSLELQGGDLSLISLALNLKLNLVPVKDDSKISVYGFAKPFISIASRTEVSGTDYRYTYEIYEDDNGTTTIADDLLYYNLEDGEVYQDFTYSEDGKSEWGADQYPALASETVVTGGIFIGPGIEFMPAKAVSIFVQAAFGYTFPVSFVSTGSYENTIESYVSDEFPMVKEGFPSLNVQVGMSFNF